MMAQHLTFCDADKAVMAMSATMQSAVLATARSQNIKHKRKQSGGSYNSCNNQLASRQQ